MAGCLRAGLVSVCCFVLPRVRRGFTFSHFFYYCVSISGRRPNPPLTGYYLFYCYE